MAEVQAVKNLDTVKLISHLLKTRYSQQMSDVWEIGLNLALRISDLLSIKFDDIQNNRLTILESKTNKLANIPLNDKAQQKIKEIQATHPSHIYLFQSFRSPQQKYGRPRPLSRRAIARAFKETGDDVGIHLGTHSMRKTRGYHLYQQTKDIARVMKMLRHSSEAVTLRYIGITQQEVDNDFINLEL